MAHLDGVGQYEDLRKMPWYARVVPDDPYRAIKPEVVRPCPLQPTWGRDPMLDLLVDLYKVEFRRRTGGESSIRGLAAGTRLKMAACLDVMLVDGIPPAAWCGSSFEQFDHFAPGKGAPRLAWVWSGDRLNPESRSRLWFREHRDDYTRPKLLVTPLLQELKADWERMQSQLTAARPKFSSEAMVVVEVHFPGTSYEQRVASARREYSDALRGGGWSVEGR